MRIAALALAVLPLLVYSGGPARAAGRCEDLGQAFGALPAAFHEPPPHIIAASSDRNLWLAAERALARWDGCHLRSVALPERAAAMRIFSLWTSTPDELWLTAVADNPGGGVVDDGIFRWDGRRWAEVPRKGERVPVALRLWGARRGDVWLYGGGGGGGGGDKQPVLLRSDGRAVTPVTPAPPPAAYAGGTTAKGRWHILGGSSSADVWLKDQSHNRMLHFDGRDWTELKPGTDLPFGFNAMWGDRLDAMFGIGQSSGATVVWRWDGRKLSALPPLPSAVSPQFVTGAAGTPLVATQDGAIFSFDGKAWTRRFAFRADGDLFGRGSGGGYLSTMQAGWAVASVGRSETVLLDWDGKRVRVHGRAAAETVTAVWAAGADDVWATTSARYDDGARPLGAVLHRVNGRWTRVAEARAHLLALSGAGPADVWAAGTGGTAIRCEDKGKGMSCKTIATGTDDALVSLWRAGGGRVWAGGREGTLLEWDGSAWNPRAQPRGWKLTALVGTDAGEIWAAGSGTNVGGLLRWSGGGWTRTVFDAFVVGDALVPVSLAAGAADGLWAAGQRRNGNNFDTSIVKWNGQRWQEKGRYSIGRDGNANLNVVAATGGDVWVAGARLWRVLAGGGWEEMDTGAAKGPIYALSAAGDALWAAAGDAATPVRIEPAPKAASAPAGGKANVK
jgi:hypothetical protein